MMSGNQKNWKNGKVVHIYVVERDSLETLLAFNNDRRQNSEVWQLNRVCQKEHEKSSWKRNIKDSIFQKNAITKR
jgi:hypothetical protein